MYEIKTEYLHGNLTTDKKNFTLVIILLVQDTMIIQKKSVASKKMKQLPLLLKNLLN